jgi:hypothetical protein
LAPAALLLGALGIDIRRHGREWVIKSF